MKKLSLAGAALLTGTAFALPAHAEVFNGVFIGAEAGYNTNDVSLDGTSVHINKKADLNYGMIAGLDLKVTPRIVVGGEGEVSLSSNDFNFSDGVTIFDGKAQRTFGLTGRVGYLLGDRFLVYGRAGYANARFRFSDSVSTSKSNFDGFKYGGGVELELLSNLGIRAEYTHTNFGSNAAPASSTAAQFSPNSSRFMVGAAFYF
jgi:outer membrane immunogenic protein